MASLDDRTYGVATLTGNLSRMIMAGLQAGGPDETLNTSCIAIERRKHHVLKLGYNTRDEGRVVPWVEEEWQFCVSKYLPHVLSCSNSFHLEPVLKYEPKSEYIDDRATLTFVVPKELQEQRTHGIS